MPILDTNKEMEILYKQIADNYYMNQGRNRHYRTILAKKVGAGETTIHRMMKDFKEFKKINFQTLFRVAREVGVKIGKVN